MFLGLDISSSITGVTVLDKDGEILLCEALDTRNPRHFPNLFEKAAFVEKRLREIKKEYKIKKVYVEQSLQAFRPGFSSAKTILTLAKMNGIVSYVCFRIFKKEPEYIGATTARKLNEIKVAKGEKAKEIVLDFVLDNEDSFSIEYTKHGNPKPGSYDRADSLIIARAGYKLWKETNSKS